MVTFCADAVMHRDLARHRRVPGADLPAGVRCRRSATVGRRRFRHCSTVTTSAIGEPVAALRNVRPRRRRLAVAAAALTGPRVVT